jgi:hypothetical protein
LAPFSASGRSKKCQIRHILLKYENQGEGEETRGEDRGGWEKPRLSKFFAGPFAVAFRQTTLKAIIERKTLFLNKWE